uniref:Uncharacterized protein n=1 Tax=Cannabis sativa TaxID=3483 RepID=A0A803PI98_CANSA
MTEEQRMFADKMSQKRMIKISKASDAMAIAKLTTAKKSKTEGSKQVFESNFTDVPLTPSSLGICTTIKRNADFLDPEVVDETLGPTGVANNRVADAYKILQVMLFIRENYPVLEKKNKKLIADNAFLKLENGKYVEKERKLEETIKSLKGELEEVKKELIDEKKRTEDLACEAEQVALTAVIKTRGELMIEYQDGKNEDCDVAGELKLTVPTWVWMLMVRGLSNLNMLLLRKKLLRYLTLVLQMNVKNPRQMVSFVLHYA